MTDIPALAFWLFPHENKNETLPAFTSSTSVRTAEASTTKIRYMRITEPVHRTDSGDVIGTCTGICHNPDLSSPSLVYEKPLE